VGVEEAQRLVLDDPRVSRDHLEIRLDPDHRRAWVVDTSTNGTRLGGVRIERGEPQRLQPGDVITVGGVELRFESRRVRDTGIHDLRETLRHVEVAPMVMAVGDIVDFSGMSEEAPSRTVIETASDLFRELRPILRVHQGTLGNYAGDAFFGVWELDGSGEGCQRAVDFTLAARERVRDLAPILPVRRRDGRPLELGWSVVTGEAAMGSITGVPLTVLGDAVNLAFRLAGLAGREGREPVLVTEAVRELIGPAREFAAPEQVRVKGRQRVETVYGVRVPAYAPK
jgi:class 3 adenylate cyclase